MTAQYYCAGAALGHAASELGAAEPDLIAESEEQWRLRFQIYGVYLAIYFEGNSAHGKPLER